MLDSEGHGKSDGLWAYIKDFSVLVDDNYRFIKSIKEYEHLKTFLWGDSMGGATAIKLFEKNQNIASGAVLVAPMIKISDSVFIELVTKCTLASNLCPDKQRGSLIHS